MAKKKYCDGYLYNLWKGVFKEVKGEVWLYGDYPWNSDSMETRKAVFHVCNEEGICVKHLQCSANEGMVLNRAVWLKESDKATAAKILIDRENEQIAKLEYSIECHKDAIDILKREIL